jgi:hypothetical protein
MQACVTLNIFDAWACPLLNSMQVLGYFPLA